MSPSAQPDLQIAFEAAETFLSPVLRRNASEKSTKARSLLDALGPRVGEQNSLQETRNRVLQHAGQVLQALQDAGVANEQELHDRIQDLRSRRLIDGLCETIVLEGVYPFVEQNVGIPLARRFISLQSGQTQISFDVKQEVDRVMSPGLTDAINVMLAICQSTRGLFTVLISKCLSDIVTCLLQLIHNNASRSVDAQKQWQHRLHSLIKVIPSSDILIHLTPLLHQKSPDWLRQSLTPILSHVPLRPDGVRALVSFLATSETEIVPSHGSQNAAKGTVNLSLDVLKRCSMALTTIPGGMQADLWYSALQPQLQALLESPDSDSRRVASYVIAIGILGRRETGSPDSIGWRLFIMPLLYTILPSVKPDDVRSARVVLSTAQQMAQAIQNAFTLCLTHPVPALLRKVVGRILFALSMILASSSTAAHSSGSIGDRCSTLLRKYIETSEGDNGARNILNALLSEDYNHLEYSSHPSGVSCHLIPPSERHPMDAFLVKQKALQSAIDIFDKSLTRPEKSSLCVSMLQEWIHSSKESFRTQVHVVLPTDDFKGSFLPVIVVTLFQRFQQDLAEDMDSLADLTAQLDEAADKNSSQEIAALVQQLLPFILALLLQRIGKIRAESESISAGALEKLKRVAFGSTQITKHVNEATISALQMHIKSFSSDVDFKGSTSGVAKSPQAPSVLQTQLDEAMEDLTSPLAPIRAEGIAKYKKMLNPLASGIDMPTTLALFSSLLNDGDEYVHLAAINVFETLALVKPQQTLEFLCLEFVDQAQLSSLDKRLRVSEALQAAISSSASAKGSIRTTMSNCLTACIHLASRRVNRSKEFLERETDQKNREKHQRKLVQDLGDEGAQHVFNELEADVTRDDELAADILSRWHGQGHVEDVRLRASALSCLEVMLRKAGAYVLVEQITTILELAFNILLHETANGEEILRRGAVVLVDAAFALMTDTEASIPFTFEIVHGYMTELDNLTSSETDQMVRGHLEVLRQNNKDRLEAMMQVKVSGKQPRFGIGDTLSGLSVSDVSPHKPQKRPVIEELT